MNYFWITVILHVTGYSVDSGKVSVKEGDSVILRTDVETNRQEDIRWCFNKILIAEITGDLSFICTDVQCNNEGTERFRDRLKLDHQTGSLTIRDIRTTDSGDYRLEINSSSSSIQRNVSVTVTGVSAAERDEIKTKSVKEGESVTLDTYVINKPDSLMWHFNETAITGDQCKICTDVQCEYSEERFRERLKLDNQTGSLTITNIRTTDSGLYKLQITSYSTIRITSVKSFSVTVFGVVLVPVRTRDKLTLHTGVETNQQEEMRFYFNDILITEITGNLRKICTNVRCKERFKDRLKLDEFGSLTIMNITTEDVGEYKLQIRGSIVKIFYVSVTSYYVDSGKVSVKEGNSVTLHNDVEKNQQKWIIWHFYDIIIAGITEDLSYYCTDVQCYGGNEKFKDRLELDHQTGSLTIRDIRTTDSGDYTLHSIISSRSSIWRKVSVNVTESLKERETQELQLTSGIISTASKETGSRRSNNKKDKH